MTTVDTLETVPSAPTTGTQTPLSGRWLWIARVAWATLSLAAAAILITGILELYSTLRAPCSQWVLEDQPHCLAMKTALSELGLSPEFYATYLAVGVAFETLLWVALGAFIFLRRPDERLALFFSLALVLVGAGVDNAIPFWAVHAYPILAVPVDVIVFLATASVAIVFVFPDGRFVPRWTRWLALAWVVRSFVAVFLRDFPLIAYPNYQIVFAAFFAFVLYAFAYRYWRVADSVQRQQIKWVLVSAAIFFPIYSVGMFLFLPDTSTGILIRSIYVPFRYGSSFLFALGLTFSILRYRLWDVDVVINRGLVYGALTVLLISLFGASLFAITELSEGFTEGPLVAVAISAAIFGALFQPVRRWLRAFVDRRLYGIQVPYATPPGHTASQAGLTRTQLGQYTGLQPIGGGGMADVYRADHPTLNRPVAVKMLPARLAANEELRRRFVREAQTVAVLKHPNIVQMFDFGEIEGIPYMVMEFIDGPTLSEYLRECGQLSLEETGAILSEVSSALDYAHAQGLVHRDIKPGNVMLEPATSSGDGRTHRAVLMDFGIAKVAQAATRLTHTGVMGTFDYMSPEQIQEAADVDGRADVYALGVMTYQMLTGELPFKHASAGALLIAHLNQPAPDPRTIRPELANSAAEAILKAMEKHRERRFESAGAFAAALY